MKNLVATVLLSASVGAGIGAAVSHGGSAAPRQPEAVVRLDSRDLATIARQIEKSGATGTIMCKLGGMPSKPELHFCGGGTGGFFLDPEISKKAAEVELFTISGP